MKIFAFSLPSQPFHGCRFAFHIFFHNSILGGCTLFSAGLFWIILNHRWQPSMIFMSKIGSISQSLTLKSYKKQFQVTLHAGDFPSLGYIYHAAMKKPYIQIFNFPNILPMIMAVSTANKSTWKRFFISSKMSTTFFTFLPNLFCVLRVCS